jgi:putative flippase GtrA
MFKKWLQYKTDNWFIQISRSMAAGFLAFCVDFSFLYILTEYVHIYYLLSATISFILGLITIYFLSIKWIFNRRKYKSIYSEIAVFILIETMALGFNVAVIWLLTDKAGLYYLLSKVIAGFIVFWINFLAKKYFLFI